jgi:hypothetical protein
MAIRLYVVDSMPRLNNEKHSVADSMPNATWFCSVHNNFINKQEIQLISVYKHIPSPPELNSRQVLER